MMLKCYIACGEVYRSEHDAERAEHEAFTAWVLENAILRRIKLATDFEGYGDTSELFRKYWDKCVNVDESIDDVKVVHTKECTVEIESADSDDHVNGVGLWC